MARSAFHPWFNLPLWLRLPLSTPSLSARLTKSKELEILKDIFRFPLFFFFLLTICTSTYAILEEDRILEINMGIISDYLDQVAYDSIYDTFNELDC